MHVNLLGPVEAVSDHGGPVGLGGPKERAVLAMLALQTGSTVSADRLIDGLWGDQPPASAVKLVQLYVSHLRRALAEDGIIATHGRGYELHVARHDVDAARFERLLAQGAAREALRLWRGSPLADVAGEPFATPEIRRLEELRSAALEVAIDQDLDAGRHREVLPEIDGLLAVEPLRERLHACRMLALYRSGRQADALEAYSEARHALVEQIGVEPGRELRRLHEAILRQDPDLDPPVDVSGRTPLFGREQELERLRSLWRHVRDGSSTTALITGAPGIGKTRLALALAEDVRRDGGEVNWGDLQALTPGRPTLLVLDAPVARLDPGEPVLVVITAVEPNGIVADERIALGPLEADDAQGLARFDAGADEPVDRITAMSRGVPGLIRQAARDWARGRAMARVADAAARTSVERLQWQSAEGNLAARVVELQGIGEPTSAAPGACPYKGLDSFDVEDSAEFFGRERLVAEMVARLPGARLLGIVGPSGSGKSSVMRAGLLAAISAGVLPGSERWARAVIRPGEHPLRALPEPPTGRALLAVDQFEELFTACRDERERAAFVDALVLRTQRGTIVVIAVRADYYGACARYPNLSRLLGANHVLVGPMQRHELRRAVELPARQAGVLVEPGLADALVTDVENEPGALPMLSTALFELWDAGLTLDAYERTGGVRGAVARLAETAYRRLGDDGRTEARRILLRLSGEGDVRTRVPLEELGDGAVLSALARDRLVTIGEGEAEVAHEALLREWPRLRSWLEQDAEARRLHRHLTHAARDWNGDPSELYRGTRLAAALEWADAHTAELSERERDFLAAGRAAAEHAAQRQRRSNRRLRASLAGVAALLALAVVAAAVAVSQRAHAREAAVVADAQRLGAEALVEDRLDRALLLASAGVDLHSSVATQSRLLSVLLRNPAVLGELTGDGWPLFAIAVSPDGRRVAISDERGGVIVYDAATRRRIGATYHVPQDAVAPELVFSPDGRTLALTAYDESHKRTVVDLLDAGTARRTRRFELPAFPDPTAYVLALVAFHGHELIAEQSPVEWPDGGAPVLWRLDPATGREQRGPRVGHHAAWSLISAPDAIFVTSARDRRTYELSPNTLRVRRSYPDGDRWGAVSGHELALASRDGAVRLYDLRTGRVRRLAGRHATGQDMRLVFTPDGRTLATSDASGEIIVWQDGRLRERLLAHTDGVPALAVSPDGRTLYSAGRDAKLLLWDLAGDRRLDRRFAAGPPLGYSDPSPKGVAFSGRTLAVTQADGTVDLKDAGTLVTQRRLRALRGAGLAVAFSSDGKLLAVTGDGAGVTLWDARSLRQVRVLRAPVGGSFSQSVVFSPNGRLLASGEFRGRTGLVRIWDVRTGRPLPWRFAIATASVAFSPDGRLVAAAGSDGDSEVRDVRTGRLVARPRLGDFGRSVAFSPDGKLLAVGLYGGTAVLLRTRDWTRVGPPLQGHRARLTGLAFSPDGQRLATAGADGTVRLWDVASHLPIGTALTVRRDAYVQIAFDRDGTHLFAIPDHGRGVRWEVSAAAWKRQACLIAGRQMTQAEWRNAAPAQPFSHACASGRGSG
jgi:WD40 repeat protein/DNA-binding SARP family transcriptional activator